MLTKTPLQHTEDLFLELMKSEGSKFVSFLYRAKGTGELARHLFIVGFHTHKVYEKDIAKLDAALKAGQFTGLKKTAAEQILESRVASLTLGIGNNPEYRCAGVYGHVDTGLMVHVIKGGFYLRGLAQDKTVIEKGVYKHVNHRPITVAKKSVYKELDLPGDRIRTFKLGNVLEAKLNGNVLVIDTVPEVDVEL